MKAVRIHEFGGPDKVQIEEIATPPLQRGKALVRVRAAGVNPVDWAIREHLYNPRGADRVPLTLGQDFAGVIEKIGPGSKTRLREGDEVFGQVFGSDYQREHFEERLRDIDVVLDPKGGETQAHSWQVLKQGGT